MPPSKIMMAEAQQPLGLCINRMADLGKLWREDGSDEMVEKMCWSCFGVFDWDSSWSSTNCPQQIWNYSIEHACAIMHLTTSYASRLQEGMSIKAITAGSLAFLSMSLSNGSGAS